MAPWDGSDKPFKTPDGYNPYHSKSGQIIAITIIWQAISFATIVLRLFARFWADIEFGLDDVLIYIDAILVWGYNASILLAAARYGLGQHIGNLTYSQVSKFQIDSYAMNIWWPSALTFSKLSLLAFYWRVFWVARAKWPLIIVSSLNIAWTIAATLVAIFPCHPLSQQFNPFPGDHAGCINLTASYLADEAITMILDLAVLLMPAYFISQLQKSTAWKVNISLTFLLGLAATLVAALREWKLARTLETGDPSDVTYVMSDAAFWSIIEVNIWILVASIPALRPLFHQLMRTKAGRYLKLRVRFTRYMERRKSVSNKRLVADNQQVAHRPSDGATSSLPSESGIREEHGQG